MDMEKGSSLYFRYKGHDIQLVDTRRDSTDPLIIEFNALIEKLNLRYSYAKLFELKDEQFLDYPINLIYKNKQYSLNEFVDEDIRLSRELSFAGSINGLGAIHNLEVIDLAMSSRLSEEELATCIETFRLFQDVYNTFSLARFALLDGYKKLHLHSTITWESGDKAQLWLRTYYLNNAIIWYNSCFDILLQTLWIGKKYYQNRLCTFLGLCNDFDTILSKCRLEHIPEKCMENFSKSDICKYVRDKANKLKHRNGLRYKEFVDPNLCWFKLKDYDSLKTVSSVDIEEVISNLTEYHKSFIALIEEVKEIINNEFTEKYNISL